MVFKPCINRATLKVLPEYFLIFFNLIQGCVAKADLPKIFPKTIFKPDLPGKEQTEVTRGKGDR